MQNQFLDDYFSDNLTFSSDRYRHSCLLLALRDARLLSNRNVDTGVVDFKTPLFLTPQSWPSALLYLIILEQIGFCFKPANTVAIQGNPIYLALNYFSSLPEKECRAIEALRHSFAHSFGLTNVFIDKKKQKTDPDKTHIFTLIADKDFQMIKLPLKSWDGNFKIKNDSQYTQINIWKLGDFVEKLVKKVKEEYSKGNIELVLKGGLDELKTSYTILIG
jgi:hypothetical protein